MACICLKLNLFNKKIKHTPSNRNKKQKAFSLIEMMIVISLIAVLTFVISPSLATFVNKSKLTNQINVLNSHLQLAKSTAATQFVYVVFCPSANRISCSNNWEDEIISFIDQNDNRVVDKQDTILTSFHVSSPINVYVNRNSIRFSPINTATTTTATIALCFSNNLKKALVISNVGRIRTEASQDKIKCK